MSRYVVRDAGGEREPFGDYLYDVFLDGRKVAEISHDYRGDDLAIYVAGQRVDLDWSSFRGGGPEPVVLGDYAVRKLDEILGSGGEKPS